METAGRAAAQIHRLRLPFPWVRGDLAAQRGEVRRLPFGRENARREIAVSAFLRAKRIGNVDSGHVSFMITRGMPMYDGGAQSDATCHHRTGAPPLPAPVHPETFDDGKLRRIARRHRTSAYRAL